MCEGCKHLPWARISALQQGWALVLSQGLEPLPAEPHPALHELLPNFPWLWWSSSPGGERGGWGKVCLQAGMVTGCHPTCCWLDVALGTHFGHTFPVRWAEPTLCRLTTAGFASDQIQGTALVENVMLVLQFLWLRHKGEQRDKTLKKKNLEK